MYSVIVFSCLLQYFLAFTPPRGVPPDKADIYQEAFEKNIWKCGSKTLPFSAINNNICDCEDGSDEPGTSACPNGSFFCPNYAFQPQTIPSYQVDDGVCDCCDGSDETGVTEAPVFPLTTGAIVRDACRNTCLDLAAQYAQAREEEFRRMEAAHAELKRLEELALEKIAQWDALAADASEALNKIQPKIVEAREQLDIERRREEALRESAIVENTLLLERFAPDNSLPGTAPIATLQDGWTAAGEEPERYAKIDPEKGLHLLQCVPSDTPTQSPPPRCPRQPPLPPPHSFLW